eukprot:COSAG02_NODE_786_length_17199_cov_25.278889_8_plen_369_part_00
MATRSDVLRRCVGGGVRPASESMEAAGSVEDLDSSDEGEEVFRALHHTGTALLSAVGDPDAPAGRGDEPTIAAAGSAAAAGWHATLDGSSDDEWDADAVFGAEEQQGGGVVNDARWAIDRFLALPPVTLCWLLALIGCGAACAFRPDHKVTLALHWPSAVDEPWRLATTFCCLGGEFFSFHTLMSVAVVCESVASYERVLGFTRPMTFQVSLPLGQRRRRHIRVSVAFLCLLITGAGFLLASQYWGVRAGFYRRILHQSKQLKPAAINQWFRAHPWLSHDLIFLLLSVSCWDQPYLPTELGFIPGLPSFARWQLPLALSAVHIALGGSIYVEAIIASIPTHIFCNVRALMHMLPQSNGSVYTTNILFG